MPNHVTNNVIIEGNHEDFMKIAEYMKSDNGELGTFDFNKIIPMPKELNIEAGSRGDSGYKAYRAFINEVDGIDGNERDEVERKHKEKLNDDESWKLGKAYYENIVKYGYPNWYEWCWDNWGTKWNSYDGSYNEYCQSFTFTTAWSCVDGLIRKLSSMFPQVTIEYKWADEDIGYNVGVEMFKDGKIIYDDIPEDGSSEALSMASEILDIELEDIL